MVIFRMYFAFHDFTITRTDPIVGNMQRTPPKLERKKLSDQIIEELVDRIASGNLKAGDKLPPEPQLMEQFGVGRSSIREAVGALEILGLLSVRPGQGTRITEASEIPRSAGLSLITLRHEKIRELVEARTELEEAIVRFAAERATNEDIAEIKKQHKALIRAKKNNSKLIEVDLGFHMAIAAACHNDIFIRFFSELHQPMRRWMEQKAKYDWGFSHVEEEHRAIIEAIEAHDVQAAQDAMRAHIKTAGDKLITAMESIDGPPQKESAPS